MGVITHAVCTSELQGEQPQWETISLGLKSNFPSGATLDGLMSKKLIFEKQRERNRNIMEGIVQGRAENKVEGRSSLCALAV